MSEITVATLLALIDDLDRAEIVGRSTDIEYLDVTRWNEGGREGGNSDEAAVALIRQLARERLGSFSVEDVGLEVLRRIDRRVTE